MIGPDDLGDHLAGADDLDLVALADVLGGDQLLVVQRRAGDRHAATSHRLQLGVRVERAGAAHVDLDLEQAGHGDVGRELPRDGPARLAAADHAQLVVKREIIDLHHHAVDLEVGSCAIAPRSRRSPLAPRPASYSVCDGARLESPARQRVQLLPVRARVAGLRSPPRRRRRTGAGASRSCSGSSWRSAPAAELRGLAKGASPSASRSSFIRLEAGVGHIHLAPDLHHFGVIGRRASESGMSLIVRRLGVMSSPMSRCPGWRPSRRRPSL